MSLRFLRDFDLGFAATISRISFSEISVARRCGVFDSAGTPTGPVSGPTAAEWLRLYLTIAVFPDQFMTAARKRQASPPVTQR